jgi:uncharacterized protein (TIGR03382 family)
LPVSLPVQEVEAGIVGGSESEDDSAVFLLDIEKDQQGQARHVLCSATLIGSRTLITAAHCVAQARWVRASNAPQWTLEQAAWHPVQEVWLHPQYDVAHPTDHDLGFALLTDPSSATPREWNRKGLQGLDGAPLRAVGYGTSLDQGEDSGIRRSVDLTLRDIGGDIYRLGDKSGRGICHGDSGGPSFHVFPDGVERLVGVHSFTATERCVDGGDVRVDTYAPLIAGWLRKKDHAPESPSAAALVESTESSPGPSCGGLPWPGLGLAWVFRRRRNPR